MSHLSILNSLRFPLCAPKAESEEGKDRRDATSPDRVVSGSRKVVIELTAQAHHEVSLEISLPLGVSFLGFTLESRGTSRTDTYASPLDPEDEHLGSGGGMSSAKMRF